MVLGSIALLLLGACPLLGEEGAHAFDAALARKDQPRQARLGFENAATLWEQSPATLPRHFLERSRAWYLAGHKARAVLVARRGLTRFPGSLALREHWSQLHDALPAATAWVPLRGFPGIPTQGWLLLMFALSYPWACWGYGRSPLRGRGVAAGLSLAALTLWLWQAWIQAEGRAAPIVVVAEDFVTLRQGNGPSYTSHPQVGPLRLGMEARLLTRRGAWCLVRTPTGETGWLPVSQILIDEEEESMPTITHTLLLPQTPDRVFASWARSADRIALTPPNLHLEFVAGPAHAERGVRFTWKAKRYGLSQTIVTEVLECAAPSRYAEAQIQGPFPRWLHALDFSPSGTGTLILDTLTFDPPTGMLGLWLTADSICKDVEASWQFRDATWPSLLTELGVS